MNHEATVRTLRESLIDKTFAGDPEAFKELESAKVRRDVANDPKHSAKQYERWYAKQMERGGSWRASRWRAYTEASESEEVMIRWGLRR